MASNDGRKRSAVDHLRGSPAGMIDALASAVIREHVDRIEPATVADLFALSELGLAGTIGKDLDTWAARAKREIRDMPEGAVRGAWLEEIAQLPAESVPTRMREAIHEVAGIANPPSLALIESLVSAWNDCPPAPVVLPTPKASAKPVVREPAKRSPSAPRAPRTPASMVDPRRGEWVREDALTNLALPQYVERGLKESIFVAGILHRSPYKDLTSQEVMTELRKLERERKLKHTGERWTVR